MKQTSLTLAITLSLFALPGFAAAQESQPSAPAKTATDQGNDKVLGSVEVSAKLDRARNQLSPSIGASQYVMDAAAIDRLPLGDSTPVNQILLQAPGVVQDSYGQLHVRGDHANLQYRINGVILPESISGFGQSLDPDIIEKVQLLTGALPAQYGYRTAGVVEITTESGAHRHHDQDGSGGDGNFGGKASLNVGSQGTINPQLSLHGSGERWSWFLTGEYLKNDLGIENPTPARNAIHDRTHQTRGFGYVSYLFNENLRASFMFGQSNSRFQIPNNPGQTPSFDLAGATPPDSATLDQRQREITRFGILSLQGGFGATDYQIAVGQRYTSVDYRPDTVGDLIFNGVAGTIHRGNRANTLQADFSTPLASGKHTLRYGIYASSERPTSSNNALVFPADADGNQTSTTPFTIVDTAPRVNARTYGVYLQDEWSITDKFTLNYGLRADKVNAYVQESQTSPRIGFVYQMAHGTTLHAGYARYFTPPPTELISPTDIALFQGTTNQVPTNVNTNVKSERSNYYDIGVAQKVGTSWTFGLDVFDREVRNLLDEGQFGTALVYTPFNYEHGRVRGAEFSVNYAGKDLNAYFNLSSSRAKGRNIITNQFNFGQDELDYVATHWVHLDHDQRLSGSGGISYNWHGTTFGADFLYGSGLRRGYVNSEHLPEYWQLNLSVARNFNLPMIGKINTRLAVINATDQSYQLRDGSGIGVGAPQWSQRAGAYLVLSKAF
ncbi:TonB-dependent receptor [Solilutibacter silvestris]|uniref:TonB dependent receptor n=1 Tax=Solilutibacter silvestris TaxID=1645665 RepID=A0A2K1PZM9_9GAMM|nr:TonB-dependent receptor [Lysobacter silvestris]PNS08240.1 TonB dependent receptor [Lysobacter silvestris]